MIGGIIGTSLNRMQAEAARQAEQEQRRLVEKERDQKEGARRDAVIAATAEVAERRQAEIVESRFQSVFRGIDPIEGPKDFKGELTRQLDEVAASLEKEYAGKPRTRARLRNTLGLTWLGLGDAHKAVR